MVTNRVYKVLANTGTEATSISSSFDAGDYLILKEDGTKYTSSDTPANTELFQIAVKSPAGNIIFGDKIRIKDVTSYQVQAYTAKVEQVTTLTIATPAASTEYTVSIFDDSDKEILPNRQNKRSYTVLTASTGETASTLATKFRAKINADTARIVNATGSGADVVLTAIAVSTTANIIGEYPAQTIFTVTSGQVDNFGLNLAFGTIVATTAPVLGNGAGVQVRTIEQRGLGYTGVTNRTKFPVETGDYTSVLATNYDVIVIEAEKRYDSNSETFGRVGSPITQIVPITTGSTTAFVAVMNAVLGKTLA